MRVGVRVGAVRCYSAPQPRSASLPRHLRCRCSSAPLPAFPRSGARSSPFDPAAVRICCPFVSRCGSLCGFACLQVKRRRQKGGARSWQPSFQETTTTQNKAEVEKALISTVCRSPGNLQTDLLTNYPAAYTRPERCSSAPSPRTSGPSCRVHLEQAEFDDATDMDASRERIGGSCHHPAPSQLYLNLAADAVLGWHVLCVCRRGARRVGVTTSAMLAQQPDFGVFLTPLWLVLRGS